MRHATAIRIREIVQDWCDKNNQPFYKNFYRMIKRNYTEMSHTQKAAFKQHGNLN